jgi:hypothetical protein
VKAKNQNRTCPDGMSNECIVWQGGDVPFLHIENGDTLDFAEKNIADGLVELYSKIDMSQIDMHCIEDNCAQKCVDTTLKAVIQNLYDNQCCLNDLINSNNGGTVTPTINVNMRCLTKFDDFGNTIPQDINQSIQSIVNQTCQNTTDITSIKGQVTDIQNQVDAINTTPVTPPEVNITTCLTSLRPISQTVPIVAQTICDYKTLIGDTTDVSQAMAQQCANLNTLFSGVDGWNSSVSNMAQSFANLWTLACNLNSRLALIENNCCKVTCDSIKIGFDVQVDSSGTGVFLKFTAGAGTSIPSAFTDAGSSVTFTDKNNNYVTYPLVISNNANQGDFDLSGLDVSDPITISVTAIMSTDGLTCEKCITRLYTLSNTSCPVCQVTASGTSGSVTIAYTLPGNQNVQTLVLQNAQVGYIQKNAIIVAVSSTGDVTADSSCINLTPPPTICYILRWEHASGGSLGDASFTGLIIGNLNYTLTNAPYSSGGFPLIASGASLLAAISAAAPAGIITPSCVLEDSASYSSVTVTVPQSLPLPIIKITNPGSRGNEFLYLYGEVSTNATTDCGCNSSGGSGHPDA